jgi:DNA-binding response OmpR family regulator/two-component sensor histidine kinase
MSMRILSIEDQEDNRRIIHDLLTSAGFEVIEAATGEEGVALAKSYRPDLILMDIQLPDLNGYEATRRIKAVPGLKGIPIIVVTSYALGGDEEKARAAGCDAYITKPYHPLQLLQMVRQHLPGGHVMGTPPRILIADDDPMSLDIFATRLKANGYEVLTAEDGGAAWELVKTHQPDLVLLDVMMPKKDGIQVCRLIKEDSALPFIPVVIVTAKTGSEDIVGGLDAGADEYLTKPVDHAALVARVQSMLRIKELYDKTREQASQLEAQAVQLAEWNKELKVQLWEEAKLSEIARLLGDIGHDMKNLMTPVLVGAQLLDDELHEVFSMLPQSQATKARESQGLSRQILDMILNNAQKIQDRVKEIADAVKGRSSPPKFGACELDKIVTAVFDTLRVYAETNQVSLAKDGLEGVPVIQADANRLFNAFYNLVNNAVPETSGGAITIRAELDSESHEVIVSVVDNGRGMPSEIRDSLFTSKVISRKAGGTGLGTKIVKDVVEAHRGHITVDSEPGIGTAFRIRLPLDPTCIAAGKAA